MKALGRKKDTFAIACELIPLEEVQEHRASWFSRVVGQKEFSAEALLLSATPIRKIKENRMVRH
jgi:hypothetical protein